MKTWAEKPGCRQKQVSSTITNLSNWARLAARLSYVGAEQRPKHLLRKMGSEKKSIEYVHCQRNQRPNETDRVLHIDLRPPDTNRLRPQLTSYSSGTAAKRQGSTPGIAKGRGKHPSQYTPLDTASKQKGQRGQKPEEKYATTWGSNSLTSRQSRGIISPPAETERCPMGWSDDLQTEV